MDIKAIDFKTIIFIVVMIFSIELSFDNSGEGNFKQILGVMILIGTLLFMPSSYFLIFKGYRAIVQIISIFLMFLPIIRYIIRPEIETNLVLIFSSFILLILSFRIPI